MRKKLTLMLSLLALISLFPLVNANSQEINVGQISLNPEFPEKDEIITVSVQITLEEPEEEVDVEVYIDEELFRSLTLNFENQTRKTFHFTIDTYDYDVGLHYLEVKATVDSVEDSSRRTFSIEPASYVENPEHCLSIENIWSEENLQPGKKVRINAEIFNCGSEDILMAKARLSAFSKTYYTGYFNIPSRSYEEIFLTLRIPEDAEGKKTFKLSVWDNYTSDTYSKSFLIESGAPYIELKRGYRIEKSKPQNISFFITNTRCTEETFFFKLSGKASEWVEEAPTRVTLAPKERRKITVTIFVPSWVEEGYYNFELNVYDHEEYSFHSSLLVVEEFTLPAIPFGWILFIVLVIIVIILTVKYLILLEERHKPIE